MSVLLHIEPDIDTKTNEKSVESHIVLRSFKIKPLLQQAVENFGSDGTSADRVACWNTQ
jgi:hypothetical protein